MKKGLLLISVVLVLGMFATLAYAATPEEIFKAADDAYSKKDLAAVKASIKDLEGLAATNEAAAWRFGRASYFVATRLDDAKVQEQMFDKAYKAVKVYFDKGSKDINTNYFFALCAGKYGKLHGIISSLFLVSPMKKACNVVISKDPSYEDGAALTILGAIEYEVPTGNIDKCIEYCNKALKYDPAGIPVNLYLGKAYYKKKEYAKAKERLEYLIANGKPETKDDRKDVQEAKDLLAKVLKKMAG
jgi:tetratricopeptide (TPR) repeat protein